MSEIYKLFGDDIPGLDWSDKSLDAAYLWESRGIGNGKFGIGLDTTNSLSYNGYVIGKKMMGVTVAMWKQDLKSGLLFLHELYEDKYPHWWLDEIFANL